MPERSPGRLSRLKDRLARSSHVFLLGVIVACGVEVLVDWNSTFTEVGVLRARVRDRGMSYVSILGRAAAGPLRAGELRGLERLTGGLFDDAEVAFVRFVDPSGAVVYERARPEFAARFAAERGQPFADYYAKQLRRDAEGVMRDPERERADMARSRYRDLAQRWNEAAAALQGALSRPPPEPPRSTEVLFQEAVRTAEHTRDGAVTWAFGTVEDDRGELAGAALVAFDMGRTNAAVLAKYAKGAGMVVFFVGLILAQNVLKRRDQLRLLDLEKRYAQAKRALREALPPPLHGAWSAAAALDQAEGVVDGLLLALHPAPDGGLEALVLDPDGEGVDAAAVALHVRAAWRSRREAGLGASPLEEARALGAAALQIPLTRPVGLWLLRVSAAGEVHALGGPMGGLRRLAGGRALPLEAGAPAEAPPGVVGPLTPLSGQLAPGEGLLLVTAGLEEGDPRHRIDAEGAAGFALRAAPGPERVADVLAWARGRAHGLAARDVAVLAIDRQA